MAGDWIKMRAGIAFDPAVISISSKLGMDEYSVVGRLHHLWSWADAHTTNGNAIGVTLAFVDRYVSRDGFGQAMVETGWLLVDDAGITIPLFDRHNGESAKRRALASERQAKWRGGNVDTTVTQGALPEKRREEKSITTKEVHLNCDVQVKKAKPGKPVSTSRHKIDVTKDEVFLAEIKRHYPDIDIERELRKMQAWLMTPKGKGKCLNRQRIVNWLNRVDAPVNLQNGHTSDTPRIHI